MKNWRHCWPSGYRQPWLNLRCPTRRDQVDNVRCQAFPGTAPSFCLETRSAETLTSPNNAERPTGRAAVNEGFALWN